MKFDMQLLIYLALALVLLLDGILTLMHKPNLFSAKEKKGNGYDLLTGLILLAASGLACMFGLRVVYHYEWAKAGMWIFIVLALIPTLLLTVKVQKEENQKGENNDQ